MAADPRVARWVAIAVGRRASQVQRTLARTLAMKVPLRLLGVLEDLAAEHGREGPGGVGIGLPLTQDLLASMVGATRESVNRAVADLERRGLVRRIGIRYVLASSPAVWGGGRR
jgi:CRP-like cAMP-binding protein